MTPLSLRLERVALRQASLIPGGYKVADDAAPSNLESATDYYRRTGRVCVWSGASGRTIFSGPGVNYAFRAWHDWRHICLRAPFDYAGERRVWTAQSADLGLPWDGAQRLLWIEVMGQLEHKRLYGAFPVDQRSFAQEYLRTGRIVRS